MMGMLLGRKWLMLVIYGCSFYHLWRSYQIHQHLVDLDIFILSTSSGSGSSRNTRYYHDDSSEQLHGQSMNFSVEPSSPRNDRKEVGASKPFHPMLLNTNSETYPDGTLLQQHSARLDTLPIKEKAQSFFQNECQTTLNDMVIAMAKYSTPQNSKSWTKNKRILSQAKSYYIPDHLKIFNDTTKNIIKLLNGYGLVRLYNDTIDSDITLNDTILIDYSIYDHNETPQRCTGSKCKDIPRISLQTEQIKSMSWAPKFIKNCHESPNCILWDFSTINIDWAKTLNASDSFMIVPYLFHDRLQQMYPKNDDELLPYHERTLDIAFFGLITKRRKEFHSKYIAGTNNALSPYKVEYRKLMFLGPQVEAYKRAKICLVLHAYIPDSAGEYHRISDFKRFGCIPIMESFSDALTVRTLETCAGIYFADYEHLADVALSVLTEMNHANNTNLFRRRQLAVNQWWRKGIDWESFLEVTLGPRQYTQ